MFVLLVRKKGPLVEDAQQNKELIQDQVRLGYRLPPVLRVLLASPRFLVQLL